MGAASVYILWSDSLLPVDGVDARSGGTAVPVGLRRRSECIIHGFAFSDSALSSGEAVRELNSWVLDREFKKSESLIAALSWHVQHHPAYYAIRDYAIHCHAVWSADYPGRLPSFDEWRRASDNHTS